MNILWQETFIVYRKGKLYNFLNIFIHRMQFSCKVSVDILIFNKFLDFNMDKKELNWIVKFCAKQRNCILFTGEPAALNRIICMVFITSFILYFLS